jgi:hypothetical protein
MTATCPAAPRAREAVLAPPLLLVSALLLVCTAPDAHAAQFTVSRTDGGRGVGQVGWSGTGVTECGPAVAPPHSAGWPCGQQEGRGGAQRQRSHVS